jgi:hypothetical protein
MLDAILQRLPGPGGMWLTRAIEASRRREVKRVVVILAVLAATGAYLLLLHNQYKGDAYQYWQNIRGTPLYITAVLGAPHGFIYAPAIAQAMWPIVWLPWPVFYGIWLAILTASLFLMARPWLACVLFPMVLISSGFFLLLVPRHALSSGNLALLMSLAVVAGFRWPSAYAFLLLTKITPAIGLLWFVVRREWSNLAIALGTTAAIVAVSYVLAPNLWADWLTDVRNNSTYPEPGFAYHILPLIPRLVIAAVLTVVGAQLNVRWVIPIAAFIALPYIWDTSLIMLVAVVPLLRNDKWTQPGQPLHLRSNLRAWASRLQRQPPATATD